VAPRARSRGPLPQAARVAGPPALALAACLACWAAGWRGTDWAAQIYRSNQVATGGLVLWGPGWYGGTFPLSYSLLFPLAGAYLGLWPVAALSAAGAAFCFDRLVSKPARLPQPQLSATSRAPLPRLRRAAVVVGEPLGSWYFALLTFVPVAIGQLPTLAGEALALGSVLALSSQTRRRRAWHAGGLVLGLLAALTTPVAGSFLAMALVAWGIAEPRRRALTGAGVLVLAASAALPLAFESPGWFPFSFAEAAPVVLIAVLLASPLLEAPGPVRATGALYALVTVGLWAVRTPMGDNDARLAAYIGVPLVICYLPRPLARAGNRLAALVLAAAVTASLAAWDWSPALEAFGGASDGASSVASYYVPLAREVELLSGGRPVKVEVPPLAHHWESAYLAPQVPLARGWERQLDIAYAPIFYRPNALRAGTYRQWLLANGVSYVALANAPLDYAAVKEAALLRSGRAEGLVEVWHDKDWELWKVMSSYGLASPPARVTYLGPDKVVVRFSQPGESTLKLRWSRYWSLPSSTARQACLRQAPGGWTELALRRAGSLALSVSLVGADHGICPRLHHRRA